MRIQADDYVWPENVPDAIEDQRRLQRRLSSSPLDLSSVRTCLAVGVGYSEYRHVAIATAIPTTVAGEIPNESAVFMAEKPCMFPYKAGLFAYREGPAVMELFASLPGMPDLLVFCSQGTAHPRGIGLAAHLALLADTPSIGITRKPLLGKALMPEPRDASISDLRNGKGSIIGFAFRPLTGCEPFYASPGHKMDLPTLRDFLLGLTAFRGCFPAGLSVAQSAANRRAFRRALS